MVSCLILVYLLKIDLITIWIILEFSIKYLTSFRKKEIENGV